MKTLPKLNFKVYSLVILLSLSILLIFSWIFALERIISADTATYFFNLINNKTFNFGSQRFIASLSQVSPLLLIYLKAPLSLVLKVYSLNLFLVHTVIAGVILFVFKDIRTTLVLLLAHLIAGSLLFYYPVTEYQMGLSWILLLYSFLIKYNVFEDFKKQHLLFVLPSFFVILYSHPLSIIFLGFIIAYILIQSKQLKWKTLLLFSLLIIGIWLSKYLLFKVPNDTNNLDLIHGLKLFPEQAWKVFWTYVSSYDFLFLGMVMVNVFALLFLKKYRIVAFYFFFMLAHLYMCLSKLGSNPYNWYSAHIYQALYFATALIFIEKVWSLLKYEKIQLLIVVFIIGLSINQTFHKHHYNTDRISYIRGLILKTNELGTVKGLVPPAMLNPGYAEWLWALDMESMIISTYDKKTPTTTVVIKSKGYVNPEDLTNEDAFIIAWTTLSVEEAIDKNYFDLKPAYYQFLE